MKRIYLYTVIVFIIFVLLVFTQKDNSNNANVDTNGDIIVTSQVVALRSGPGLSYESISSIRKGQALTMIEQQGEWYYISVNNEKGWVPSWQTSTNVQSSTSTKTVAISQVDGLNIRTGPSTSSTSIKQLNLGDEVLVESIQGDWVKVDEQTGISGWLSAEYVVLNEREIQENDDQSNAELVVDQTIFAIFVDSVNVREQQNLSSNIVGLVNKGDEFSVLEKQKNWVKIQLEDGREGWIYEFYGTFQPQTTDQSHKTVTIVYNGTNLRESPSTSSLVVTRANAGESFEIISENGDWYQVSVSSDKTAYLANWVVSTNTNQSQQLTEQVIDRKEGTLNGLSIVLDPGHGGNDQGTAGSRGTIEKDITLITAELLKSKLQDAGATVYLTRESDEYIDLRKRVSIAHMNDADAFISIHYDATEDSSISGFTTYYYHDYQQELAQAVNSSLANKVPLRDRGAQPGNYLVLRENYQNAILIELGYLSNPSEERVITTDFYREQATLGIYEGILEYFDSKL
nr:SH3 domain-containing protein [Lysinibacillus timonensis]